MNSTSAIHGVVRIELDKTVTSTSSPDIHWRCLHTFDERHNHHEHAIFAPKHILDQLQFKEYKPVKQKSSTFNDVELLVCGVTISADFDYTPGTPDVLYMPNGDPGEPGTPDEVTINSVYVGSEDMLDYLTESFKAVVVEKALDHARACYDDMGQEEYDAERAAQGD